jgi:hypothetical protein
MHTDSARPTAGLLAFVVRVSVCTAFGFALAVIIKGLVLAKAGQSILDAFRGNLDDEPENLADTALFCGLIGMAVGLVYGLVGRRADADAAPELSGHATHRQP